MPVYHYGKSSIHKGRQQEKKKGNKIVNSQRKTAREEKRNYKTARKQLKRWK